MPLFSNLLSGVWGGGVSQGGSKLASGSVMEIHQDHERAFVPKSCSLNIYQDMAGGKNSHNPRKNHVFK